MAAPQRLSPNEQKALVDQYVSGATVASLVERFDVSAGTVRSVVRRAGVALRPVGRPRKVA